MKEIPVFAAFVRMDFPVTENRGDGEIRLRKNPIDKVKCVKNGLFEERRSVSWIEHLVR